MTCSLAPMLKPAPRIASSVPVADADADHGLVRADVERDSLRVRSRFVLASVSATSPRLYPGSLLSGRRLHRRPRLRHGREERLLGVSALLAGGRPRHLRSVTEEGRRQAARNPLFSRTSSFRASCSTRSRAASLRGPCFRSCALHGSVCLSSSPSGSRALPAAAKARRARVARGEPLAPARGQAVRRRAAARCRTRAAREAARRDRAEPRALPARSRAAGAPERRLAAPRARRRRRQRNDHPWR